jgi:hypothetical protein
MTGWLLVWLSSRVEGGAPWNARGCRVGLALSWKVPCSGSGTGFFFFFIYISSLCMRVKREEFFKVPNPQLPRPPQYLAKGA